MLESVSRKTFGGSSGTYNVRASELARERGRLKTLTATVVFLDNTQHTFQLEKNAKGHILLELVFQHLELVEKDYFGLQFAINGLVSSNVNGDNGVKWLDPSKSIRKQIRGGTFFFRVKFYVSDPSKLQEEYTRYHFYLQIRKDILQGRLMVSANAACLLASYILQSELGDYHPGEIQSNYLSEMALIHGQSEEMESKIIELYKLHKGQSPSDAEFNFLDHAKRLDMYGVDLHRARDCSNKELQIGVTANGVAVFQNNIRINLISWVKIVKISFKRKQFFVQIRREPSENYDTLLSFNMITYRAAKNLWKSCVEHHSFFRLHSPYTSKKLFHNSCSLGSKFRYSGKTEFQTVEEGRHATISRTFYRSSFRTNEKQAITTVIEDESSKLLVDLSPKTDEKKSPELWKSRATWCETSSQSITDNETSLVKCDDDIIREHAESNNTAFSPILSPRAVINFVDDDVIDTLTDLNHTVAESLSSTENYNATANHREDSIICIKIKPDKEGIYGFNVKGGSDMNMPILVSRVAPNTPADASCPKLNEGDEVLTINGRDISGLQHDQVISLIRSASNYPSNRELILTIKRTVPYTLEGQQEPPYQYVPESPLSSSMIEKRGGEVSDLQQSILFLADGLASGALVDQFEQLYHKKPGLTCNEAKKTENLAKNRYRDVSPYDATRVILNDALDGDYINANYVNMEIPRSGLINRYIATQGPLQHTVSDFWQMVAESKSTFIIMLTTIAEKGRSKCVKYWPPLSETIELENKLTLKTTNEEIESSNTYIIREFVLHDQKTAESRNVTQLQYLAWPDHGVPDSVNSFLSFTQKVRKIRAAMQEPTIVHCSAGVGRTGVLILMETAMCLIEANEAVYPLDIVKQMRDQRAMMIQTPSQYKFVSSCIHYTYMEGLVRPLPEFIK